MGKRAVDDARNTLFGHFFRLVAELRPRFFVAENVPGILAPRFARILEAAFAQIPKSYVVFPGRIVRADRLGAPTTRARVFFVGFDPDAMDCVEESTLFDCETRKVITVGHALRGLPNVRCDWQREEQGWRAVEPIVEKCAFHDRTRGRIPAGVGDRIAIQRLRRSNCVSGNLGTRHTEDVIKRFTRIEPGSVDAVSGAVRLDENGFCPTLRAGTGTDRGSFQALRPIHFKSPRVITPREAARLQGFPDWFQFDATKWHSFRQIGNSVSPLVAEAILKRIRDKL
jgi:DNA (cytosine-5)-methyltransferase 1